MGGRLEFSEHAAVFFGVFFPRGGREGGEPRVNSGGSTCLLQGRVAGLRLEAGFEAFIVRAARQRSRAISVMPLLLRPNNCRTSRNCGAALRGHSRSAAAVDCCRAARRQGFGLHPIGLGTFLFRWRSPLRRFELVWPLKTPLGRSGLFRTRSEILCISIKLGKPPDESPKCASLPGRWPSPPALRSAVPLIPCSSLFAPRFFSPIYSCVCVKRMFLVGRLRLRRRRS